ncbi:hypothetical protein MMYC01_208890 [Madurella mycetomatis]|uniref:Uncharacterized protein n=1 Tax=Madurella mycetomatis TaxID=100816 RepID=A0A175VV43_9PEZI|nr:hypothetical protein MMYC01_208890 [Madurella mycetomatis]
MLNFRGGDEGHMLHHAGFLREQDPITAECFLPPPVSFPRPWQRVAVNPVPGQRRQRKIWKRVGGLGSANSDYIRAMAELEQQGQGSRKRARQASHIPPWGDAQWNTRGKESHDGKQDLAEARAIVSLVKEEEATAAAETDNSTRLRPSMFPEESLKWVPRKRHNSRWPIEPRREEATSARMVAAMQPLIEFDVPAEPQPTDTTLQIDESQMRRRSTRRLSRRISLFPSENSPRKLSMVALSPAKTSKPVLSPVKRPPVTLSPAKVADSPLRSFRVNATPTKVVLESPKTSPPEQSPSKASTITQTQDVTVTPVVKPTPTNSFHAPASPVPLIFDQPTPDAQAEPQHETRRRVSLYSARRIDRGSSGASRLLALKAGRGSPNRRHSFTAIGERPVNVREGTKGRRNTLDMLHAAPEVIHDITPRCEDDAECTMPAPMADEVVEIDMKTNPDIFGQQQKAVETPQLHNLYPGDGAEEEKPVPEPEVSSDTVIPPAEPVTGPPHVMPSSSVTETLGVAGGADAGPRVAAFHQAATGPDACAADIKDRDRTSGLEDCSAISTAKELTTLGADEEQSTTMFAPHDPEGLSTIYEEPSIADVLSSGESGTEEPQRLTLDASSASSVDKQQDSDKASTTPSSEMSAHGEPDKDDQGPAEVSTETDSTFDIAAKHVITTRDALSSPDSPDQGREAASDWVPQQAPTNNLGEHDGLVNPSEDSVAPPAADDSACRAFSFDLGTRLSTADSGSPSRISSSGPPFLGTVTRSLTAQAPAAPAEPEPEVGSVTDAAQHERPGFTPINTRQTSPSQGTSIRVLDQLDGSGPEPESTEPDDLDEDELIEEQLQEDMAEEVTIATDEDFTLTVEDAPRVENDTLQLRAMHDDSEMEMLRKFVTRVAADKNAKAVAEGLAKKASRPPRRSGPAVSMTSSSGSPMPIAKPESGTPVRRKPLGERSPNSPSPAKKRKLGELLDFPVKDKDSADPQNKDKDNGDNNGHHHNKRRRRRLDPVLAEPTPSPSPEPASLASPAPTTAAPRRSTRTATRTARNRVALRPTAPSANAIALSMIPARFSGMGMGTVDDEAALEAHLAASARARQQRSEEKDLATVTRVNTRKNKAGAVPPQMVLAKQAEDPQGWRMRELKGVFDAREAREKRGGETGKKAKGVRWAEELVSFHTCEEVLVERGDAVMQDVEDVEGVMEGDEIAEAEPMMKAETKPKAVKKAVVVTPPTSGAGSTRRAAAAASTGAGTTTRRSSRLQAPTPVKKMGRASSNEKLGPATASASKARALPKLAPAPAAAPAGAAAGSSSSTATLSRTGAMTTRRSKIAKLGMSANGTPGPKRRGRATA